jgi:4a-hydroxytetrahydrobiopterin dehydratase
MDTTSLSQQRCITCNNGMPPIAEDEAQRLLATLPEWQRDGKAIYRTYRFKDHYETLAFVNALGWISHRTDHHPDISLGYNQCRVAYWTHTVDGLSINDFICAAKADALLSV